ncbi:MAG: hypothetical protein A2106_04045 [Planctomycetes bacterium GWF2_40_8]|nr:MAG: hypothetical protein A2106_04045 [Planctomycetes bacterium GWF2_40_8]OHB87791.1 MAG: hypothetical protein A3D13_00725 [Planctomycetes bacterium RIFCSPHIGHO2_02_FULL_40_12]OHC01612.1 MAG: hypothetical protein A3H23_00350 [Planctomycetes bacterium RIFCSPLOWO2_12_FULL_40_19]
MVVKVFRLFQAAQNYPSKRQDRAGSLDDAKLMLAVELGQILTCVLVKIKCNLSRKSFSDYQFNIIIKHKNLLIFNTNFTISK